MPAFSDHFAIVARSYATYRPHYPAALFDWLASSSRERERAWDCGTGSGQAAVALASRFVDVVATDASMSQLGTAECAAGLSYVAMTAEQAALGTRSTDLITVAQALHWFDHRRFFTEVDRVLKPGGALAVWSYGLLAVEPTIDAVLRHFYFDVLAHHWPVERALVDSGYAGIALPYPEVDAPRFAMTATWSLARLGGYLSTWSAVGRYRIAVGVDPLPELMRQLESAWGMTGERRIHWPLVVRFARKDM